MKTYDQMNSAWDAWVDPVNTPARATSRRSSRRRSTSSRSRSSRRSETGRFTGKVAVVTVAGTLKGRRPALHEGGGGPLCGIDAFFNNAGILGDVSPLTE